MAQRTSTTLTKRIAQRDRSKRIVAAVSAGLAGCAVLSTGALVLVLDHHAGASTSTNAQPSQSGTANQPYQGATSQDPYGQPYTGNGYGDPAGGGGYGYPSQGNAGGGYATGGS